VSLSIDFLGIVYTPLREFLLFNFSLISPFTEAKKRRGKLLSHHVN
jgi:hypothetical protein